MARNFFVAGRLVYRLLLVNIGSLVGLIDAATQKVLLEPVYSWIRQISGHVFALGIPGSQKFWIRNVKTNTNIISDPVDERCGIFFRVGHQIGVVQCTHGGKVILEPDDYCFLDEEGRASPNPFAVVRGFRGYERARLKKKYKVVDRSFDRYGNKSFLPVWLKGKCGILEMGSFNGVSPLIIPCESEEPPQYLGGQFWAVKIEDLWHATSIADLTYRSQGVHEFLRSLNDGLYVVRMEHQLGLMDVSSGKLCAPALHDEIKVLQDSVIGCYSETRTAVFERDRSQYVVLEMKVSK